MIDPQQAEYDAVQAQIHERKTELKLREIPKQLKALITTVRMSRLHSLLRDVVSASEDQTSFVFNGNSYSIEFKKGSPFWVPTGPRLCMGTLIVRANSEIVLESSFQATEDEWGLDFYYKDTAIYRRGDWVDELLKLKHESDDLRRAQERAYFQSKEQLASLRDKFDLPKSEVAAPLPPPVPVMAIQQSAEMHQTGSTATASRNLGSFVRKMLRL